MWSAPRDRERAAVLAEKLTPAQAAQRAHQERCFNGGYDTAIRALVAAAQNEFPVDVNHPTYVERRRERFHEWDLDQRVAARRAG